MSQSSTASQWTTSKIGATTKSPQNTIYTTTTTSTTPGIDNKYFSLTVKSTKKKKNKFQGALIPKIL